MENKPRSDKGKIRKVPLEDVAEAVQKSLAKRTAKHPGPRCSTGCALRKVC